MEMSESSTSITKRRKATLSSTLVIVLLLASFLPILVNAEDEYQEDEIFTGTIANFEGENMGKSYLTTSSEDPIFSATRHLKNQWIDAGMPDMILPFSSDYLSKQSRSVSRACENAWNQGDAVTMPTAGGNIAAEVERVTSSAAIIVENGVSIPSTTINDIASTWDNSIYPTVTSYFGNPSDVDNNCQIEVVIYLLELLQIVPYQIA